MKARKIPRRDDQVRETLAPRKVCDGYGARRSRRRGVQSWCSVVDGGVQSAKLRSRPCAVSAEAMEDGTRLLARRCSRPGLVAWDRVRPAKRRVGSWACSQGSRRRCRRPRQEEQRPWAWGCAEIRERRKWAWKERAWGRSGTTLVMRKGGGSLGMVREHGQGGEGHGVVWAEFLMAWRRHA